MMRRINFIYALAILLTFAPVRGDYRGDRLRQLGPVLDNWPDGGGKAYAYVMRYGDRQADYKLKITEYIGRDDLTMREKQEYWQAKYKAARVL